MKMLEKGQKINNMLCFFVILQDPGLKCKCSHVWPRGEKQAAILKLSCVKRCLLSAEQRDTHKSC